MNLHQDINLAMFFATLAVGFESLRVFPHVDANPFLWAVALFFFLLRLKLFADDHAYFTLPRKNFAARIGYLFGVISWMAMIVAALKLRSPHVFCQWLAAGLFLSSVWIMAVALWERKYEAHNYWIATNAVYIGILLGLVYHNPVTDAISQWGMLALLYTTMAVDYILSKSLSQLEK